MAKDETPKKGGLGRGLGDLLQSQNKVEFNVALRSVKHGETAKCEKCGATVTIDAKVCLKCGVEFHDTEKGKCQKCGAIVKADAKSCHECKADFL